MESDLEYRAYYLEEARSAIKEGLPITAKQCLANADLFKRLSTPQEKPLPKTG